MLWFLLIGIVLLVSLLVMILPLVKPQLPWRIAVEGQAEKLLLRQKARALRLLKDLELEAEGGALHPGEYERLRQEYLTEAAMINRRLEALGALEEKVNS